MTAEDEQEMHRLCAMVGEVDAQLPNASLLREGLKKAAFAFQIAFIHNQRSWIEKMYGAGDHSKTELSQDQKAYLRSIGILMNEID